MDSDTTVLRRKFKRVFREIDDIRAKIHKKQELLFFKSHVYSVEELLSSEHHGKVCSITEKIGDDVQNWYRNNQLSHPGKRVCEENRDKIEEELHGVNLEIIERQPTWWEQVKGAFICFIQIVMDNLPALVRSVLESMVKTLLLSLPGPLGNIYRLGHKNLKALTQK